MYLEHIKRVDPLVAEQIEQEFERQQNTIELIASENITSQAVMEACGSVLTNKYAEGKPHKRFYNGCEHVDVIEEICQKRACRYVQNGRGHSRHRDYGAAQKSRHRHRGQRRQSAGRGRRQGNRKGARTR